MFVAPAGARGRKNDATSSHFSGVNKKSGGASKEKSNPKRFITKKEKEAQDAKK
jgi:hypothetical protein